MSTRRFTGFSTSRRRLLTSRWRFLAGLALGPTLALALSLLPTTGCHDNNDDDSAPPPAADAYSIPANEAPAFASDTFEELYPVFLLRRLPPAAKAARWRQFHGKFVRWTAAIVSFTPNGITLKHLSKTVTFDVSLQMEPAARVKRSQLKVGDTITYIGRLDSYDDLFRTFYLVHGDLVLPTRK